MEPQANSQSLLRLPTLFQHSSLLAQPSLTFIMISSRVIAFVLGALPILAVATPLETRADKCSTGSLQCCNSTQKVRSTWSLLPLRS